MHKCVDESGEYVGEFLRIDLLSADQRAELSVAHPSVRKAAGVCVSECCAIGKCLEDNEAWVKKGRMPHWYTPKRDELPIVHGGRLLLINPLGEREVLIVDTDATHPLPEHEYGESTDDFVAKTDTKEEPSLTPPQDTPTKPQIKPSSRGAEIKAPSAKPKVKAKSRKTSQSTVETDDLVRQYLNEIGRFELLTKDDEVRLAKLIEAGNCANERLNSGLELSEAEIRALRREVRRGKDAHEEFYSSNLRLVVSIAKRYKGSGVDFKDLIQEGNIGLIRAVEKYDWRRGFKFSTYATWWIKQAIRRGIANTGSTIRVPVHARDLLDRVKRVRQHIGTDNNVAQPEDIAYFLGEELHKVMEALEYEKLNAISLETPLGSDGNASIKDVIADRNATMPEDVALASLHGARIADKVAQLPQKMQDVLIPRFGLNGENPGTISEVAVSLNITPILAKQIENAGLSRLRHPSMGMRSMQ